MKSLSLLAFLCLSTVSCSPSSKAAVRTANDTINELCKLLPSLDPVEQQICLTENELAPVVDKIFAHRRDLGLLREPGAPSATPPASSSPPPAPAPSPSAPAPLAVPPAPPASALASAAPSASAAPVSSAKSSKGKK